MAQLVRENMPLVMHRNALRIEDPIRGLRFHSHTTDPAGNSEVGQRVESNFLPPSIRYCITELARRESIWEAEFIDLLLALLPQTTLSDFGHVHGKLSPFALRVPTRQRDS
ncbi:hypothetical protein [Streptomyces sp. NPDC091040]|uniref:hypothetical protein n=1 Tax=Streptomyces sp. NPDC091040 TaxID=3365972 RepID=UPI00381F3900